MPSIKPVLRDYALVLVLATIALLLLDHVVQLFGNNGLSSLGVIAALAASMFAGGRLVERTGSDVSSTNCWIISLWLCGVNIVVSVIFFAVFALILAGPSDFGLVWQSVLAELEGLPSGTLVWIVPVAIAVGILVSRLGFGLGRFQCAEAGAQETRRPMMAERRLACCAWS